MAWIESHQSLSRHRKTMRLAALLKCDRHKVIGHLHELWWWAVDNVPVTGDMGDATAQEIGVAAGWPEKTAADFTAALVTAGFVDLGDVGQHILHDWYDYAGKLMERRAANADRMQRARATNVRSTVSSTSAARAPATRPNQTQPDPTRQTKPKTTGDSAGAAAPLKLPFEDLGHLTANAIRSVLAEAEPSFKPSERFWGKIAADYGDLDLEAEALKMRGWLRGKPKRHFTELFVLNWLKKAAGESLPTGNGEGFEYDFDIENARD